ncbi:MAG: hypothetical protein IPK65_06785 [Gammaproteobacteria bacterium]|nr:hypothetical protein [Gammaproteobacteria bacterium]
MIDPSVPPQEYSSPRRVPIIILGIVFGLIVSAVVVLVRSRFAGASRG